MIEVLKKETNISALQLAKLRQDVFDAQFTLDADKFQLESARKYVIKSTQHLEVAKNKLFEFISKHNYK